MKPRNRFSQQAQRGISLVEMLITVSVISVLGAIAAPMITSTAKGSQFAAVEANAQTVNRLLRSAKQAGAIGIPKSEKPTVKEILEAVTSGAIFVDFDRDGERDAAEQAVAVNNDLQNLLEPPNGIGVRVEKESLDRLPQLEVFKN